MITLEIVKKREMVHRKAKLNVWITFKQYICYAYRGKPHYDLEWSKPIMGMRVEREDLGRTTEAQRQAAYEKFKHETCTDSEFRAEFERRYTEALKRLEEIRDAAIQVIEAVKTGSGRPDYWLLRGLNGDEKELFDIKSYDRYRRKLPVSL